MKVTIKAKYGIRKYEGRAKQIMDDFMCECLEHDQMANDAIEETETLHADTMDKFWEDVVKELHGVVNAWRNDCYVRIEEES